MLVECQIIRLIGRTELRGDGRVLVFRAGSSPSLEQVLEACLVHEDDPKNRPGGVTQDIILDESYAPKGWRRNEELRQFFGWKEPERASRCPKTKSANTKLAWPFTPRDDVPPAALSASFVPKRPEIVDRDGDQADPVKRVRGRMIWSHKTAPELEIEGRGSPLDPDAIAAGRRR